MATITQALKIEDDWLKSTQEVISKIWEDRDTISDIIQDSAVHVRNSEFGNIQGVELTTYEKKLVMLGFMIAHRKSMDSPNGNGIEHMIVKAIVSEIIRKSQEEKSEEEGE
jgi:hypothetical protein